MNEKVINYKLDEYIAQAGTALLMQDFQKAKKAARTVVILYRVQARAAVAKIESMADDLRANEHSLKKMQRAGITFPLAGCRSEMLRNQLHEAKKLLSSIGSQLCSALDYWQVLGATIPELCNLCNRDYSQVVQELQKSDSDWPTRNFSDLIYIHNLDFKSSLDWLDFKVDAPLTHAIKEYYLDLMLHTPEGQAAAQTALEKVFPGIMDKALYPVTDADGVRHWFDKDGVKVALSVKSRL